MKIVAKSLKMLLLAPGLRLAGILETSLVLEAVMIVADFCVDGFRRKSVVVCLGSRLGCQSLSLMDIRSWHLMKSPVWLQKGLAELSMVEMLSD